MIWVTEAKALPGFRLWVRFSDNTEGEVDLKDFVASDPRPGQRGSRCTSTSAE